MTSEEIRRIFEAHGATLSRAQPVSMGPQATPNPGALRAPITDYGRLHTSGETLCEVSPTSAEEVAAIVKRARSEGIPLRVRGQGHSTNASSIPGEGELCLRTDRLCAARISGGETVSGEATSGEAVSGGALSGGEESGGAASAGALSGGALSVGAGAVLWTLDKHLRRQGWKVPVVNDGFAGPTVGGYVAAGGYGLGSGMFGGFWENVLSLTVVDGRGEVRVLRPDHGLFLWLFGAMGQLGVVTEAELSVVPVSVEWPGGRPDDARTAEAKELSLVPRASLFAAESEPHERLFWFTFFVPGRCLSQAKRDLQELREGHAGLLDFRPDYATPVRCRGRMPKLVFPRAEPFFAMGIWGAVGEVTERLRQGLFALDAAATELSIARGYRRYVQTEIACSPTTYRACFGEEVCSELRSIKREMDPDSLFGRGVVFDDG